MINTDEFLQRLAIIFDRYGLNAATFSDKIGVQRSGVSHLLSGRNKPSLDFVMKIVQSFPEVDLYWLLTGNGNPHQEHAAPPPHSKTTKEVPSAMISSSEKKILKIVILYDDGSFSEHFPEK